MSYWRPDNDEQLSPEEADDLQARLQEENDRDWCPDDEEEPGR